MNILIPHNWLLEQLNTSASPEEIQRLLSLSGPSVERIYDKDGDKVYDIEVTTNRVDSMSVRGIAREAAIILTQAGQSANLKDFNMENVDLSVSEELPLPKISNDPNLCKRITCVVLRDVKRTPTPEWMAKRLDQTDMNIHDSVIDITNYVTHELGHPCHAFDYDKVMKHGGEIIVAEAKKGEKFVTLDWNEFETLGGEIVFKSKNGEIIDLPSIKGTANTSVDDETKNILLLLESIKAEKVRYASMSHAIRTTAAQLVEKNVDPHLIMPTLKFGIKLYQELCEAKVASQIFDEFPGESAPEKVTVTLDKIRTYLGIDLPADESQKILRSLGCEVEIIDEGKSLAVTPPTFRPDIKIPADVIEEIARIYGYHNLPSVIMSTPIPLEAPTNVNFYLENRIKHFLSAIGWQEIYSYSMVSEEVARRSGYELDQHIKISNPLTDDRIYMRRSLAPSLLEVIEANPLEKELSVFEIANVYEPTSSNQLPTETTHLTLVSTRDYRQVRGEVESLLNQFFIPKIEISGSGEITSADTKIGTANTLEKSIIFDFVMEDLVSVARTHPTYQPIPKTAFIFHDMTFELGEGIAIGKVITVIEETSPYITKVSLKDQYNDNFTFSIEYHDEGKNLSSSDVEPIRKLLIENVRGQFSAMLVGE